MSGEPVDYESFLRETERQESRRTLVTLVVAACVVLGVSAVVGFWVGMSVAHGAIQ